MSVRVEDGHSALTFRHTAFQCCEKSRSTDLTVRRDERHTPMNVECGQDEVSYHLEVFVEDGHGVLTGPEALPHLVVHLSAAG